jgi:hypothetical protein
MAVAPVPLDVQNRQQQRWEETKAEEALSLTQKMLASYFRETLDWSSRGLKIADASLSPGRSSQHIRRELRGKATGTLQEKAKGEQ